MGKAVVEKIQELSSLTMDEVLAAFHAGAFELARRTGQTPRSIADAYFALAPSDEHWRDELLSVVSAFAEDA